MFLILLVLTLTGAVVHSLRLENRTTARIGEVVLRWVLVGYCGLPMLVVAVGTLADPDRVASVLGFAAGNPFELFLGWAYLGMAVIAVLALRFGGAYLIGPALVWAVFFVGATGIHRAQALSGGVSHGGLLSVFATHGLISVVLGGALVASGVWRRPG